MAASGPRRTIVPVALGFALLLVLSPVAGTLRLPEDSSADGTAALDDALGNRLQRLLRNETRGVPNDPFLAGETASLDRGGYTGEGTRIGVIGSGFESGPPWLADRMVERRRFGPDRPVGAAAEHDTAVAEIAARTAPEADLYVAGVGRAPTPERYARAVEWLVANDVDVIVDSGSYFPSAAGDARRITAAAERATANGVVFVTSAGNYARRHWAGRADGDGWVEFVPGSEANPLAGGDPIRGRVTLRLRWNSSADYDLYLYRHRPGGLDPVVAESTRREAEPGLSVEAIDAVVPRGRYYVAVHPHDGDADPATLQLFAVRRSLGHVTPHGSMVAPATGERVVAVSALGPDGRLRRSSSRGGPGAAVDVAAPGTIRTSVAGNFTGTSAAAPYVAGTAALIESSGDGLRPDAVERILETTADADGVDPSAAVRAAEDGNASATNRTAAGGAKSGGADGRSDGRGRSTGGDDSSSESTDRARKDAGGNRTAAGESERSPRGGRNGGGPVDHSEAARGPRYGAAAPGATRAF